MRKGLYLPDRALSLRFMAVHYSMLPWREIRINLPSHRSRVQSISRKNSGTSSRKT